MYEEVDNQINKKHFFEATIRLWNKNKWDSFENLEMDWSKGGFQPAAQVADVHLDHPTCRSTPRPALEGRCKYFTQTAVSVILTWQSLHLHFLGGWAAVIIYPFRVGVSWKGRGKKTKGFEFVQEFENWQRGGETLTPSWLSEELGSPWWMMLDECYFTWRWWLALESAQWLSTEGRQGVTVREARRTEETNMNWEIWGKCTPTERHTL